ncbi:MAG: hypothetical protein DME26_08220 [Verrucomicrobia bacterium]|nr:MAG: hypothetical protein DME26_08220 [Verrucomicrobiota bacterium]
MRGRNGVEASHEPGAKSGSKLPALQTLARQAGASEYREAFGVRPACGRFRQSMVPMRNQKVVEATMNFKVKRIPTPLDVAQSWKDTTGFAAAVAVLFFAGQIGRGAQTPADLVVLNAKILTVNPQFAIAEAAAIREGLFVAVGNNAAVKKLVGDRTRVIDAQGRTVVPGLIETHVHAVGVNWVPSRKSSSGFTNNYGPRPRTTGFRFPGST